jgi:hypothetical protein
MRALATNAVASSAFEQKLNGTLHGLLRWSDWDALRHGLGASLDHAWYAYAVGLAPPAEPLTGSALASLLDEIDQLLRRDHGEDYLGIVYVDDPAAPSLIKVYDPNNLGSSCGSSGYKVTPGWVLSLDPPVEITSSAPLPGNRRRWWSALIERFTAPQRYRADGSRPRVAPGEMPNSLL